MSNENINNNNNKKHIVYLLFETNSAKKDYNDEIIGVSLLTIKQKIINKN
ncbi:MAG: hypothetical protein ACTHKJ_00025 [Candidatus Nitrosocosmicus sp.]